jgi:hypothetical protein
LIEERRLRVSEYRVQRRIFVFRFLWGVVTGEWTKLHNEELNVLYCSPNIVRVFKSRRMRWARHVERMGKRKGAYGFLIKKFEIKVLFGRSRHRREDNIKVNFQEIEYGFMD